MILTIWFIAGLAYLGYLGLGLLVGLIFAICEGDWQGIIDVFCCALWICGVLGFVFAFGAVVIGYGFTWLTYHEVDIIKECNIVAACLFIGSIFAVMIGEKRKKKRLG